MRVRARCDVCGDIDVTYDRLALFHCTTNGALHAAYRCDCGLIMTRALFIQIFAALSCVVTPIEWTLPAELHEPHSSLPTFTADDLIDFHLQLERIVTVEDLVR